MDMTDAYSLVITTMSYRDFLEMSTLAFDVLFYFVSWDFQLTCQLVLNIDFIMVK